MGKTYHPGILVLLMGLAIAVIMTCNTDPGKTESQKSKAVAQLPEEEFPPRPRMWVDTTTSKKRVLDYGDIHQKLTVYINSPRVEETVSLFYDTIAFKKMIRHFQKAKYVWLDVIIADYNHKMTLLFHPVPESGMLKYYTLPDHATDFDPNDPLYLVSDTDAKKLIEEYTNTGSILKNTKMKILRELLDKNDRNNRNRKKPDNPLLNTLSIRYDSASINEMYKEIIYQEMACNNTVSGIQAMFAMIGANGYETGEHSGTHKKRLMILFEFTKRNATGQNEIFYLDSTHHKNNPKGDFSQRKTQPQVELKYGQWVYKSKGLDNGQLCPAHCP